METVSKRTTFNVRFAMDYTLTSMDDCKRVYNQVFQLYDSILELEKLSIKTPVSSYKRLFNILDQISLSIYHFSPAITHNSSVRNQLDQILRTIDNGSLKINEINKRIHHYIDRFHYLLVETK